jgi:hypothetical protein
MSGDMSAISGIELSRRFYGELVAPWLARAFPDLRHAAALIGYGSELLGYDDAMSRDHNWGPRVGLFVTPADFETHAEAVVERFAGFAPEDFLGFPIGMSSRPGQGAQGDGDLGDGARADPRHGLEVRTIETMLRRELALGPDEPRDAVTWLGLSEQQLLVVTAGAVFHDDDGELTRLRDRLAPFRATCGSTSWPASGGASPRSWPLSGAPAWAAMSWARGSSPRAWSATPCAWPS